MPKWSFTGVLGMLVALPVAAAAQSGGPSAQRGDVGVPSIVARAHGGDTVLDGIGRGAAIGVGAGMALAIAQMKSCNRGCDEASIAGMLFGWGLLGAGAGAGVGLAADYENRSTALRPVSYRPSARLGVAYTSTTMQSDALTGHAPAPAFVFAVRISRHLSVHAEYLPIDTLFVAAPGAIPDDVLQSVVEASARVAGRSYGVESRRVSFVFTELVGVRLVEAGRVRLDLLGGLGVQGEEERAYYDAYGQLVGGRREPIPGKYYVLDFGSPEVGAVFGIDAEVTIVGGLSVVPTVRYHAMGQDSATFTYGAGAHWRF